jgi:acyl dehydratase
MSARPVVTFDQLAAGRAFGHATFTCSPEVLARWRAVYPELEGASEGVVPPGLSAVIYMDAYAELVSPRPEGNVHATQRFRWLRLARVGETLTTAIDVARTEIKDGRKRVTFRSTTSDAAGAPVLEGEMVVLWAR